MKFFLAALCLAAPVLGLPAADLWQHPEAADRNSLFAGVLGPSVSFGSGFELLPAEISVDWLPPFPLPFSVGAFLKAPSPNLKSFGLRAAYHANLGGRTIDPFLLYVLDLGFLRNDVLEEYNDERQEVRLFDFRVGVRRLFGRRFCLSLETGYKFQAVAMGLSLKLF